MVVRINTDLHDVGAWLGGGRKAFGTVAAVCTACPGSLGIPSQNRRDDGGQPYDNERAGSCVIVAVAVDVLGLPTIQ